MYIILALVSALMLSFSDILTKYALNNGKSSFEYIFWSHGVIYVICIIALLVILKYRKIKSLTNNDSINSMVKLKFDKTRYAILLSGIIAFLALITIIYTFSISKNIGYTVAIISTTALFSYIISYFLFNSKIDIKGFLGILLIIFGVYLISTCPT
tara:strand:- start:4745 stop:5212 length:468 start_codon:yes stop_codon:yes gene_type:complete